MTVQVLVSSTFSDLRSERDAVRAEIEALAREGMKVEWIGMEEFGSLAATPLEASTGHTAEADLVVLIVGKRYGSRPPDDEVSFTEREFDTALRERIPCLAYYAPGAKDTDDESARTFQRRVSREATCEDFTNVDDLRRRVRRDLQREIGQVIVDTTSRLSFVGPPHPEVFVNRQAPLAQLRDAFAMETPRVALVAPAGMGKTALARRFLASSQLSDPDPLWLSIDELFGRSPSGRRLVRKAGLRWGYEALRRALEKDLVQRPKRPIVFDNAQADPRAVRWLAKKFTGPALLLTWDAATVPYGFQQIPLEQLEESHAVELLRAHCPPDQKHDTARIRDVASLLHGYPLLLDLVGRRLKTSEGLRLDELLKELSSARGRLRQQGDTIDKQVEVQNVLLGSYHALPTAERALLRAIAALPEGGISESSLQWLKRTVAPDLGRPDRAVELGLLQRNTLADWKGYRYHIRAIILDFLATVDGSGEAVRAVERYLTSEDALRDDAPDVVGRALSLQLKRADPELPMESSWVERLLAGGNPRLRAATRTAIESIDSPPQRQLVAALIGQILAQPRTEVVTVELLGLLSHWQPPSPEAHQLMLRLYRRPLARANPDSDPGQYDDVLVAAGKGLATCAGVPFRDWLIEQSRLPNPMDVERALRAAACSLDLGFLPRFLELLDSDDGRIRKAAASCLVSYIRSPTFSPDPKLADRLAKLAVTDPAERVRFSAQLTLGLWGDEQGIKQLLKALDDAQGDDRPTAFNALLSLSMRKGSDGVSLFDFGHIGDRLADIAVADSDLSMRVSATLVLANMKDPNAPKAIIGLLSQDERYGRMMGTSWAGIAADWAEEPDRRRMADLVARLLTDDDVKLSSVARRTLLDLHDGRGYGGLWEALGRLPAGSKWRWHIIGGLSSWEPPGFEPNRIRDLLHDADPQMRAQAIQVTAQRGCGFLVPELRRLLDDDTELPPHFGGGTVANLALEAIERLQARGPSL